MSNTPKFGSLVYEGTIYKEVVADIIKKTGARQVCVLVLEGNEGTGVARKNAGDSQGKDFIQDAVDAKFYAEGLRQVAELYEREATTFLMLAKRAGHKPTAEQFSRALGFLAAEKASEREDKESS